MTGRGARSLVLAVTVAMLALTTIARADAASTPQEPGADAMAAVANTIGPVPSGVPLFIGVGTTPHPGLEFLSSFSDFTETIRAPSSMLLAGVDQFYEQGGNDSFVLTVTSEDAPGFSAALAAVMPTGSALPEWDLIVIPALGSLTPTDWLTIASQMTAIATAAHATAILDPPDATVAAAQSGGAGPLTALAQQLQSAVTSPGNAVLLSSGLTDDEANPISGAAAMAGLIASTDVATGVWGSPGGPDQLVAGGPQPVLMVNDALEQPLAVAGIDSWRVLPGSGTIMFGALTLQGEGPEPYEWITRQRTVSWIYRSVAPALEDYRFAPNDAATWAAVSADISSFLTNYWTQGEIFRPEGATPFTVSVGSSTMTAQDILNGLMIVVVDLDLSPLAPPYTVTFQQQTA